MAETGDAGLYTCKTTYDKQDYEVAKVNLQVQVHKFQNNRLSVNDYELSILTQMLLNLCCLLS